MPGVRTAAVDFESKQARVTFDPKLATVDAMVKALVEAGYGGELAGGPSSAVDGGSSE